jgi:hypothetical protein
MELVVTTPIITYGRSKSGSVELIFPSPFSNIPTNQKTEMSDLIVSPTPNLKEKSQSIEIDGPNKLKLKKKIKQENKIINNKTTHISKLKHKINNFKIHNKIKKLLNAYEFSSINSKSMAMMQLKTKCRTWTRNEKNLALGLFHKSPSAYKFLLLKKVNLPKLFTIRQWIDQSKLLSVKNI